MRTLSFVLAGLLVLGLNAQAEENQTTRPS